MNKDITTLLGFNIELRQIVETVLDSHPNPADLQQGQALLAFGKAYKTHAAILILCEQGYGEDAAILARSLVELSLSTVYIAEDKTGAAAQRYFEYDFVIRDEMYKYLSNNDELKAELERRIDGSGNQEATIEEVQKKAEEVRAGYTKDELRRKNWSGKSIREIAEAVGREDIYKTAYALQCSLSHSDASIANNYVKEDGDGYMMDVAPSENWVAQTLVVSIDFFLALIKTWNEAFKLGLDEKLEDLEKRYAEAVRQLNQTSEK